MDVVEGYTTSVLVPQLRSLDLSKRQCEIVANDVAQRLGSLLMHWGDDDFRGALLVLAAEEASFWEPRDARLEIRSLVLLGVRNSLIEDLGASHPYTKELRSARERLPDHQMPWITGEAIQYFEATGLDGLRTARGEDVFGGLPRRYPVAWRALSLLARSPENEIECDLPAAQPQPVDSLCAGGEVRIHEVVTSGIDPRLDDQLLEILKLIEANELPIFSSPSFKSITRNPGKLLYIIDHVLRYGGTVLTPNYLLSPSRLARRDPLLRPIHNNAEFASQLENVSGLSERHRNALALLTSDL
jgi:hypothetical protein